MKYTNIKDLNISSISLGTVQLGLNYGIHNQSGKPSRAAAFEILDTAIAQGINILDTAAAYGDSEEVIGAWLRERDFREPPFIVTKAARLDHSSDGALKDSLMRQVETSKKRLGMETLPMLMLHNCEDYLQDQDRVTKLFEEMKANGDIRFSGISAYSFHDYKAIAASGFDATQIPVNLFDWGQIENGGIQAIADAGMMIFVRSVYLQGLVFQDPDTLPTHMAFCRDTLVKFRTLCKKYSLSPAELAISYALSLPGVTSLVLGSETAAQVESNGRLAASAATLTPAQMQEIRESFLDTDPTILNPGAWPKP